MRGVAAHVPGFPPQRPENSQQELREDREDHRGQRRRRHRESAGQPLGDQRPRLRGGLRERGLHLLLVGLLHLLLALPARPLSAMMP